MPLREVGQRMAWRALAALMLRWVVNHVATNDGVGIIDSLLVWPLNEWWMWAAAGSVCGLIESVRKRAHEEDRTAWAAQHGGQYQESVEQSELEGVDEFSLFRRWHRGRNRITTSVAGMRCEMFDFTEVYEGEDTSYYSQTVWLLPRLTKRLPSFELMPAGYLPTMLRVAGFEGVRITATPNASPRIDLAVDNFNRRFVLLPDGIEWLAEAARGARTRDATDLPLLAGLFSLELIRELLNHDGWSVESTGAGLAIWKRRTVTPFHLRDAAHREVEQIVAAIQESAATPATDGIEIDETPLDPVRFRRRVRRMFVLVCGGFLLGSLSGGASALYAAAHNWASEWFLALFFGGGIGGLAIGCLAAWRLSVRRVPKRV